MTGEAKFLEGGAYLVVVIPFIQAHPLECAHSSVWSRACALSACSQHIKDGISTSSIGHAWASPAKSMRVDVGWQEGAQHRASRSSEIRNPAVVRLVGVRARPRF